MSNQPNRSGERRNCQEEKPPRLIKVGMHDNANGCALVVPNAVGIGGDDAKGVAASGQIRIIRAALRARFRPVIFQPFEFVFEFDLGRFEQAQRRVNDFKLRLAGTQFDCGLRIAD